MPVCTFAARFLRLWLWVLGGALALAALEAYGLGVGGEGGAWRRGPLFASASGACHGMRSALPRRP
jgi:hypothetical protein